jgi:hypothetical protein
MVLDDCLIPNLTPERLKKVLDPKLKGAYLLDRYTRNQPLDFLVLFSSCASILGLPGQANYSCANAFLDALSWERQRQGLPATAVNWGFLGRVGYAASHSRISEYFDSIGITPFSPEAALEGLGQILRRKPAQIGMLGIDWPVFLERAPSCGRSAKFASFRPALDASAGTSAGGPGKSSSLRHLLQGLESSKGLEFLEAALVDQIARVLGTIASKVDVGAPLTDLGFDSLMAVELRNWVETSMGVALRTMEIMKGPSVRQLAETLLAALHIPIRNDSPASRTGTSQAGA